MKTGFEHRLAAQFADTGRFTIFILLVRTAAAHGVPLRSSARPPAGGEMTWTGMRGLFFDREGRHLRIDETAA